MITISTHQFPLYPETNPTDPLVPLDRVRVVGTGERVGDVARRVRSLDADSGGPRSGDHDEDSGAHEEDVEHNQGSVVERFVGLSVFQVVVQPHPSVRGHAHESTE